MAFLNTVLLLAADTLEVVQPQGLWTWLLLSVFDVIGNYGLRVLVFTLILKLALSPLDIFQRVKGRKNQKITERIKPDIEKLQKQYPDKAEFSKRQMALQRKEGYSFVSACLPAIATMVVFFTLFSSLNKISQYMNFQQYYQMFNEYHAVQEVAYEDEYARLTADEFDDLRDAILNDGTEMQKYTDAAVAELTVNGVAPAETDPEVVERAEALVDEAVYGTLEMRAQEFSVEKGQKAVYELYHGTFDEDGNLVKQGIKRSFLWVKNIWTADVPWSKPINDAGTWKTNSGKWAVLASCDKDTHGTNNNSGIPQDIVQQMESDYPTVIHLLEVDSDNKTNGLLIMPLLALGFSVLQQFLTQRQQKKSGQDMSSMAGGMGGMGGMGGGGMMKMMMWIMPVMIGVFALRYTAAFSIYLVMSYGFSLIVTLSANLLFYLMDKREKINKETKVQKYGRPDPKDL